VDFKRKILSEYIRRKTLVYELVPSVSRSRSRIWNSIQDFDGLFSREIYRVESEIDKEEKMLGTSNL
jgi:hypothetical protein